MRSPFLATSNAQKCSSFASRSATAQTTEACLRSSSLDDAFTIDIEEAKKMGPVWTASIEHVDTMRAESEASRRGSVAAVALECKRLAMQIVPFGSCIFFYITSDLLFHSEI